MHAAVRSIDGYCPVADLAARYPGWTVRLVSNLPHDAREVFLPHRQTLLLSKEMHEKDPALALAHSIGHLDLDHPIGGPFTHEQEMHAQFLAQVRLDREETRNDPLNQIRMPGFRWPDPDAT